LANPPVSDATVSAYSCARTDSPGRPCPPPAQAVSVRSPRPVSPTSVLFPKWTAWRGTEALSDGVDPL